MRTPVDKIEYLEIKIIGSGKRIERE